MFYITLGFFEIGYLRVSLGQQNLHCLIFIAISYVHEWLTVNTEQEAFPLEQIGGELRQKQPSYSSFSNHKYFVENILSKYTLCKKKKKLQIL